MKRMKSKKNEILLTCEPPFHILNLCKRSLVIHQHPDIPKPKGM